MRAAGFAAHVLSCCLPALPHTCSVQSSLQVLVHDQLVAHALQVPLGHRRTHSQHACAGAARRVAAPNAHGQCIRPSTASRGAECTRMTAAGCTAASLQGHAISIVNAHRRSCAAVHGDLHPENVLLQVPPSERIEDPHSRPSSGHAAALAASALDSEQCTAKISNFGLSILFQDGVARPGAWPRLALSAAECFRRPCCVLCLILPFCLLLCRLTQHCGCLGC